MESLFYCGTFSRAMGQEPNCKNQVSRWTKQAPRQKSASPFHGGGSNSQNDGSLELVSVPFLTWSHMTLGNKAY